jgi:2-oxoglutarate ferredoxin oxidoreductase subunit delta
MARVTFREDRCKGCGLCVEVCPKKIISLSNDKINSKGYHPAEVLKQEECIGCAFCATICPDLVITVEK